ncbi:hypothetical protein V2I01_17195 [Micromonospora sp. BRA006-A]|nr:hypothetical protein [Micromonospora sp. BRA006-A]
MLAEVKLPGGALSWFGTGAVERHNAAVDGHLDNVRTGVEHLRRSPRSSNRARRTGRSRISPAVK